MNPSYVHLYDCNQLLLLLLMKVFHMYLYCKFLKSFAGFYEDKECCEIFLFSLD